MLTRISIINQRRSTPFTIRRLTLLNELPLCAKKPSNVQREEDGVTTIRRTYTEGYTIVPRE